MDDDQVGTDPGNACLVATPIWLGLAFRQEGVLARRQLNDLGVGSDRVRNQVAAGRWQSLTPTVVCTTTGALTREQRLWLAVLHTGGDSLVGGLSAASVHGLRHWERDDVTVLVDDERIFDPVAGLHIVRTRRPLTEFRTPSGALPLCRVEPAVLLHAGYNGTRRTAVGLLSACVQQRLTTPDRLRGWADRMRPLRRTRLLQESLTEIEGGAESRAELDVHRMCRAFGLPRPRRQVRRRDASGRTRFTDCEWQVAGGRVVVLEVDGAFHMETEHWEDDLARQRALTSASTAVLRATARELRDCPEHVVRDLIRLGVPCRVPLGAL
ncbi:MAG: hypothetical protein JWO46_3079 [Nocardioidaceae bacterium]|nr:hypothetical protein [Nocardioidaceae bacterium]